MWRYDARDSCPQQLYGRGSSLPHQRGDGKHRFSIHRAQRIGQIEDSAAFGQRQPQLGQRGLKLSLLGLQLAVLSCRARQLDLERIKASGCGSHDLGQSRLQLRDALIGASLQAARDLGVGFALVPSALSGKPFLLQGEFAAIALMRVSSGSSNAAVSLLPASSLIGGSSANAVVQRPPHRPRSKL